MSHRDVVVVGASAGGVEALRGLIAALPSDFPAAVLVVLHVSASSPSVLPAILSRVGTLAAKHAVHGEALVPGTVFIAPPDHHLLVHRGRARVSRGPSENGHRPAVDPLFRSAARWFGPRVIAVVLSGALDDGTSGAAAVRAGGGLVLAQSPEEALYPSMPVNVIESGGADHVASVQELAALLQRRVREEISTMPDRYEADASIEDEDAGEHPEKDPPGQASTFTCPECHGALWELREGELVRYRCRVGHAFAQESLMAHQAAHVEEALWIAYRALRETAAMARRLGDRAKAQGLHEIARRYADKLLDAEARARLLGDLLGATADGEAT